MRSLFLLGAALVVTACAAAHDDSPATSSTPTDPGQSEKAPGAPPAQPPAADPAVPAPPPAPDCSIAPLSGVPQIDATFLFTAPPAMTGGTLDGEYVIEKATVYLPPNLSGLVDTTKSTGKVVGWAVFKGPRYRVSLKADFTIVSALGTQAQSVDSESQGGFTTASAALKLDHECDGALTDEADYSYTDDGGGHERLLVKTPTAYGDVYMELDALKK